MACSGVGIHLEAVKCQLDRLALCRALSGKPGHNRNRIRSRPTTGVPEAMEDVCSDLLVEHTSRTAAFHTDCSRFCNHSEIPDFADREGTEQGQQSTSRQITSHTAELTQRREAYAATMLVTRVFKVTSASV